MIVIIECLERIFPVLERDIGLLVGIELGEELLVQGDSQVEASENVRFGDEFDETVECNSLGISGGRIEAVLKGRVLVGNNETDLLNSCEFPVMRACCQEASSHGRREFGVSLASCRANVWTHIVQKSLKIGKLDLIGFIVTQDPKEPIESGADDFFNRNPKILDEGLLHVLLGDQPIKIFVK